MTKKNNDVKDNDTPLSQMIVIQDMQFKLDKVKKEVLKLSSEKRSLEHQIPKLIREMNLK